MKRCNSTRLNGANGCYCHQTAMSQEGKGCVMLFFGLLLLIPFTSLLTVIGDKQKLC